MRFPHSLPSLTLALAVFTSPLAAQDTRAAAEAYANLPAVRQQIDDMFAPDMVAQMFRMGVPAEVDISPDKLAQIGVVLSQAMLANSDAFLGVMVDSMAAQFTVGEIEALTEFYQSDEGASAMSKMQPYMQGVMADIGAIMGPVQEAALPDIIAIMQEE